MALGVAAGPADVPLRTLLDEGVPVALGADDPLLFGSRLAGQYEIARQVHGLPDADLAELARMSVRGSVAPPRPAAGCWRASTPGWPPRLTRAPSWYPAATVSASDASVSWMCWSKWKISSCRTRYCKRGLAPAKGPERPAVRPLAAAWYRTSGTGTPKFISLRVPSGPNPNDS